jgi:membrane fusion protein, multidrug efflux system
MPSTSPMGAGEFPGLTEYTTSTDHLFDEDADARPIPRGPVIPPDSARGNDQDKGKKKAEIVERPMDSEIVVDPRGTRFAEQGHPAFPRPEKKNHHWVRRIIVLSIIAAIIGAALYWGVPEIEWMLSTTSTDDAFVSGHTTNVSPRIEGVVTEVMVEQNDRVEPGTVLIRLDREPFEIALAQSEASLIEARSNLELAKAQVRSQLASARGAFFQRKNLQEALRSRIKSLEAEVATLRSNQSSQNLAALDQKRLENLVKQGSATQSELDQRNNTLDVANQRVKEAWTAIDETRAALGLEPNHNNPLEVPKDLTEQQSGIQNAVSSISSSLAQIGIPFDAHDIQPGEAFEQIIHMDTSQGLEEAFGRIIERAPAVKVATATVNRAERDLDNARLRLSWCEIKSEIAGYVQDRQANPGNRVEPGQTLVSVRPDYVWVDANFKETQLHHIEIGMPVDLYVDAYPGKVFQGRVSGFGAGTGLSESLLPPENATGNYIKVTQRLPVRIELVEPNPQDTPLFIGLSVVPYVKHEEKATGPDAGKRLHPDDYRQHPDAGGGPAGKQPRNRIEIEEREAGHS